MAARHRTLVMLAAALVSSAGCSSRPTYPKAHLAEAMQQVLASEQLKTSVRFLDHTLAIELEYPNALAQAEGQIGVGPAFDEAARKVIVAIHRVLLSTDAEIQFYVLLISDPRVPGAYLTMVRYMDDVRRANANMLDYPEMFARTIFELNYTGQTPISLEQYVPRDIHLEEFLSWQLARRIQRALVEQLQTSGVAHVGRCGGRFKDGEFAFTLDVAPATDAPLDETTLRKAFETSTDLIAKVLSSYQFESFNQIRLIHPLTGRNLVLPKTNLHVFR